MNNDNKKYEFQENMLVEICLVLDKKETFIDFKINKENDSTFAIYGIIRLCLT